jgi:hypothetical protein
MNLGTIKQAVARLRELGYGHKAVDALKSHNGRPERLEFSDPVILGDQVINVDWQLRIDALGEVTAPPLTVSLLHLPIDHAIVQGIDTAALEKQLQAIDWSDPGLNDTAALKAIGLLNHLSRSNDPTAEQIADQLMLKYWSWQFPGQDELRLAEMRTGRMVSKTYDELPRLTKAYQELSELVNQKQEQMPKQEINAGLAEKLNAAGYHGWEIVSALAEIYRESPHSAKVHFVEVAGEQLILFQMDVRFYLGGGAECLKMHARAVQTHDLEHLFDILRNGPDQGPDEGLEGGMAWVSFDGLPKLPVVGAALLGNQPQAKIINHPFIHPKNEKPMNLNNLDNLKTEMKALGFSESTIKAMEENMQKNLPEFTLQERINGNKGQVDVTIPFRQSAQSEYYYLNKYTVALNTGKPLPEGEKYMVITPDQQNPAKNLVRSFQQAGEAIAYFREQKGNSELAAGKDAAHKTTLASKENGRDNFVAPDFQRTYRSSAITQTIYVERGVGFTVQQAANLIQGRAVHRADLLSPEKGPYQAWVKLNMDKPKDRFQNFAITNYHDPAYGFHLQEVLDKYNIKELNDPAKKEALITALHNGDRPLVTVVKDGQETKLHLETAPRYLQVSLYREDGRPEKREQFLKEPIQGMEVNKDQGRGKSKGKDNEQGMEV